MRYHELAAALNCAGLNATKVGRLGLKQYGFVDQARRAATPHTVDVLGMDEEKIGWEQCAAKLISGGTGAANSVEPIGRSSRFGTREHG